MAKLTMLVASTSQTVNIFVQDSSVTTGAGLTGLVYNTGSLTAYYCLPAAAPVAITLITQTATGAWASGGFVEISSTNLPGWYRLDLPNAALASGRFSNIMLKGAANMSPVNIEIELTAYNNQVAYLTDKAGMSLAATGLDLVTMTEPAAAPAFTTGTIRQAMAWLMAKSVNKLTQTSTTATLRNNADNATISTSPVSDDGTTLTVGKFS